MTEWRALTPAEIIALEQGLNYAAKIVRAERPLSFEIVQYLYDGFIAEQIDDTDAILALGLSFGQCLVNEDRFEWVRCIDEWGDETSLAYEGAAIFVHPISMIQKRLERREALSIDQLCRDTISHVEDMLKKGDYSSR